MDDAAPDQRVGHEGVNVMNGAFFYQPTNANRLRKRGTATAFLLCTLPLAETGPSDRAPDFRIDGPPLHDVPGFIYLFGIESQGLTCALAIGEHVAALLGDAQR
jgi:L-2-hydroxyglutarate oxidase LhgO